MRVEAFMNVKLGVLFFLIGAVVAEPARAVEAPNTKAWLQLCVASGKGAPVRIREATTRDQLVPLKLGDLIYKMICSEKECQRPTLAFREGKLTEILPGLEELEDKRLVNCYEEPKSAEYPIIAQETPSDAQLIYDEFGIISSKNVKLGEYSRCPISTDLFVSRWKSRELESKAVPLARFCAAMSNNSWFWFDPETGQRRAYYQISYRR